MQSAFSESPFSPYSQDYLQISVTTVRPFNVRNQANVDAQDEDRNQNFFVLTVNLRFRILSLQLFKGISLVETKEFS
jgi:hypothetical protein